jgi:stage II sporulation protein GA (sporulation sigma-E factor processing peptidase)
MCLEDEVVLEVYVDVVVLLNLVLNGLALWGTGRLFHLTARIRRILAGALLGAVYALMVYFLPWRFADSMVVKILTAAVMVRGVYGKRPFMTALRLVLGFYLVSFAMGGAVTALAAQRPGVVRLVGVSALCVGAVAGIARWLGDRRIREQWIWRCRLTRQDQSVGFSALLDTGNQLKAPFTGEPVVILERRAVSRVPLMERDEEVWRTVSFQTAGGEANTLMAFEPEGFEIYTDKGWREVRRVLVALSDAVLDRENRYQGLLPPEILNEMGEFDDETDKKTTETQEGGFDQGAGLFEKQNHTGAGEAGAAGGRLLCGRQRGAALASERGGGAESAVRFGAGRGGGAHHIN